MMMPPESSEAVIKRICRALSMADGFALYFVLVNLPAARKMLSQQVQEQLARPVIELDVPLEGFSDTTLDGWLLPQLQGAPAESAVFLHGLDSAMPSGRVPLRRFLQQLNWRRAALKRIARPLVIWLPRHALDSMAEHAPDLYDWYSNVYEFASPKEETEELLGGFLTEFSTAVHPAYRLNKAEKEQWLHTLAVLLDEHPQRNAYRAKLLNEAGLVHQALGSLEDALALYQQSLAIRQEIGDRVGEGVTLNNISQIYDTRGDYGTALKHLEQSLVISQDIGDREGEAVTLSNIGALHHAKGDYGTALKHLKQSLVINQEIGDRKGEGATLNNISQIYDAQGDYGTALKRLEQSLVILREIGDRRGEAVTNWNIGRAYEKQGDLAKAEQYISRAVQLAEEIGHPDLEEWRGGLERVRAKMSSR
jgi:tetratricopeptide (TPR) repeat protein